MSFNAGLRTRRGLCVFLLSSAAISFLGCSNDDEFVGGPQVDSGLFDITPEWNADAVDTDLVDVDAGCVNDSYLLSVPYHNQLQETVPPYNPYKSCGQTALLMVLDHFGLENQLTPVIEHSAAIPMDQGGFDQDCTSTGNPVCLSAGVLIRVAEEHYGLEVTAGDNYGFEEIRDALCADFPLIALIKNKNGNGHFVTIVGIRELENETIIVFHDPGTEAGVEQTWETFSASWQGPVDVDDPLQPAGHTFWGMVATP